MDKDLINYDVIIDPTVNDRMYDHYEFLSRVGVDEAEKLLNGLIKDINSLKILPYRNPVYDRPYIPRGKYRYMLSCERYRIVYQIVNTTVFIDDIQDCRQSEYYERIK